MRADLHLHSVFSDGKYSPAELASLVKREGVELFAITDHDNLLGCGEGEEAARALGLRFVHGWEISSFRGEVKVHVLGYGCEINDAYRAFHKKRVEAGKVRVSDLLRKANDYFGIDLTMDDVEAYHVRKDTPLHDLYVIKACAKRLGRRLDELSREVFQRGGPVFSELCRPTPEDAIEVIHATGGVAVLAHPGRIFLWSDEETRLFRAADEEGKEEFFRLSFSRMPLLLERLLPRGLDGIECHYPTHTASETEWLADYAASHGLMITGGSDFHAENGRNFIGKPDFEPDEGTCERLLSTKGSV